MKTKEQVVRYVSRRSYPEDDWRRILLVCRPLYGSGIKKASHPKSTSDYQEFNEWLVNGFGDGEIVSVNGMTGIFCDNGDGTCKLLARYSLNQKIVIEDVKINLCDCKAVDGEEFYMNLRKQGYQYFLSLGVVSERKLPRKFQTISFSFKGSCFVGIVGKSTVSETSFLCVCSDVFQTDVTYNTYDLDFFSACKNDVKILADWLNKKQLRFDKKTSQLIWARKRALKGEAYWFITDTFSLKMVTDKRTAVDDMRYNAGNYFLTYGECEKFRNEMTDKRKGRQ